MKLTTVLIIAACLQVSARGYSQKVTLNQNNVSLIKVFEEIRKQTGYQFFYADEVLVTAKNVTVNIRKGSIEEVLDFCFQNQQLGYTISENTIIVKRKVIVPKVNAPPPPAEIKGTVKNDKGEPLAGATVVIKGKKKAVTANSEGIFTIDAEPGDVLVISSVGYLSYEVTVSAETNYTIKLTANDASLGGLTVIGSRGKPRTDVNRPVPVDVISSKELQNTGQVDLAQQLQFTSPSFNSAKTAVNGLTMYADPATLRGMSPDQSLVLVNTKRRHQFSAVNNNITVGRGTVVTDLNGVPSLAVERLEVLRDGAAAQYGSDAIAGIVNLELKKSVNTGAARMQFGVNKEGDGGTALASVNYGFKLGKPQSYLNLTLHYQYVGGTDRIDPFTGTIYNSTKSIDDSIRNARGVWPTNKPAYVGNYGSSQTKSYQAFMNFGYPIGKDWTLYSFGGLSKRDIVAYAFFRSARPNDANSDTAIFPNGFLPKGPGNSVDYSLFTGVSKKSVTGWNIDLSTGYGLNYLDLFLENSANPSMGALSPTEFYIGRYTFGQSTTEATFSKNFENAWGTKSINLAFGSQLRIDNFKITKGDTASYGVGPLASPSLPSSQRKNPGSTGRSGVAPSDEVNASRTNVGFFVDIESDITDKFLVALAGRYENYSDFGSNISGKLATRYRFAKNFALRASVNRGFRAPSLQQINFAQNTGVLSGGVITQSRHIRSDDSRLTQIGIEYPKPELSWSYNVGLTAKAGKNVLFTVDAYQIDVTDRIIVSEQLTVSSAIPALLAAFPASTGIRQVTFFTNHINTRTKGIDFVTSFKHNFKPKSGLTGSIALTFNKTEITSQKATPSLLQAGAAAKVKLIDTVSISIIETALPKNKILISLGYQINKFNVTVKATRFGEAIAWEKPAGLPHRSQTFSAKTLTDLTMSYDITKTLNLTLGANNIFDVYPDKVLTTYSSYNSGQTPYSRNIGQFGFNGAYYYTTLNLKF